MGDSSRRHIEPGFNPKNFRPEEVIAIKQKYADSVYALFKRMRYGIETCCEFDLDKIDMRNQMVDLGQLYDPDLCVSPDLECCPPPCNVIAELILPDWRGCDPPENVSVILSTP